MGLLSGRRVRRSSRRHRLALGFTMLAMSLALFSLTFVPAGAASNCLNSAGGNGVTDTNQKCINVDNGGAALVPYSGLIRLPSGTDTIGDEFSDHVPATSQFQTVTGAYQLVLVRPDTSTHTYDYTVTSNANAYPTPNGPSFALGFTVSAAEDDQYTLYVNGTIRSGANSVRNQVWFYSGATAVGHSASASVLPAGPAPVPSPSPSPTGGVSPGASASPSAGVSPTPTGGSQGNGTSPSPTGGSAGAGGGTGAAGTATAPATGHSLLGAAVGLLFAVTGSLLVLSTRRRSPAV